MTAKSNHTDSEERDHVDIGSKAKMQGALTRLQNLADRTDALDAIRDILANLVGAEEIALFRFDQRKATLWLQWYQGIDPDKYAFLDVLEEPLLEHALAGKIFFRGDHGCRRLLTADDSVSALIPVNHVGVAVGLLVIFRLLPQKLYFESVDREICEAIARYGGIAIARPDARCEETFCPDEAEEE